ncbi:MAG: cupin domain-containing protein [Candidatus Omnitrophica bacterium]|nr:cupin domain-containing protein [Candidatus Omnitrophota bacterium]
MERSKNVKVVKLTCKEQYQRLLNRDSETYGIKSGHVILKPGDNIGRHATGEYEEVIIILKGKAELKLTGKKISKAGYNTVLYIPPQTYHDIKNIGAGILEYIFITSKVI